MAAAHLEIRRSMQRATCTAHKAAPAPAPSWGDWVWCIFVRLGELGRSKCAASTQNQACLVCGAHVQAECLPGAANDAPTTDKVRSNLQATTEPLLSAVGTILPRIVQSHRRCVTLAPPVCLYYVVVPPKGTPERQRWRQLRGLLWKFLIRHGAR